MSKVLILNGSPRKNGNTTKMVEEFVKSATNLGHEIFVENVAHLNIKGCMACEYCHNQGQGVCVQKDDMQKIYPILKEVDTIIFASPVYYFTMSAQIQSVLQRSYALWTMPNLKKCGLILSSESSDVYDAIVSQFNSVISWWGAENLGIVTAPGIHFNEDNSEHAQNKLKEVYNLALKV